MCCYFNCIKWHSNGDTFLCLLWHLRFAIKNVAETNLLYDSVPDKKGKGIFSKIEEKGARNYYFLDGITSMLTGFLFVINGYIPMMICLMFTVIAIAMSTCFLKKICEIKKKKVETLKGRIQGIFKTSKQLFNLFSILEITSDYGDIYLSFLWISLCLIYIKRKFVR